MEQHKQLIIKYQSGFRRNYIQDINNINFWLKMNKLKLNETKTKLLQINMNDDSVIKIHSEMIKKVYRIKYLKFIADKDIKLNEHIDYIAKNWQKKLVS